jgi:SAM-dependent methyltransferase
MMQAGSVIQKSQRTFLMMKPEELTSWFENAGHILETAYIVQAAPWQQSGMSGPRERWETLRKPVADCMDRSGSFLDIGCANGYLLECCLQWTAARGIQLDPYGLDISSALVALAKTRLPQFADHFFVGNSFYWIPPRKFDYVRTELVYVPGEYEKQYLEFLLDTYLEPDGKLLIAHYNEGASNPQKGILPGSHPTKYLLERLTELGFAAAAYRDGYDTVKQAKTRVAVLKNSPH